MKRIKDYLKYILIFVFSFFAMSFFFSVIDGDVLWNYGFSYALSKGEIPYVDFNMIITPFYPFFNSIFFRIFSHNIVVFYIVNSFLITYMFSILFKMYDYKAWFLFLFLFFPVPAVIFPSYNLLLIFLTVFLLYLEKERKSDYSIGFILGIAILTKQTVGVFLCLPSLYYLFVDKKKVLKRVVACFVPCFIFLMYLIYNNAWFNFLDLCLFGMFDFTEKNGNIFNVFFALTLIMIIYLIFHIRKNPHDIKNYYILFFSVNTLPLFDLNHFLFFFFIFLLSLIDKLKFNKKELYVCESVFVFVYIILFLNFSTGFNVSYPNHYRNFETRFMYNSNGEFLIRDRLNDFIQKNKDNKIIILSSEAYFYKITNEMEITFFDLINKGNNGFNGTNKMINKLNQEKDALIIISYDEFEINHKRQQIDKEIIKYVIDNGNLIQKFDCFRVYKLDNI